MFDAKILRWHEAYAVGVELIDEEHRRLFAMLEELHGYLVGECDEAKVRSFALGLIVHMTNHLAEEEAEMERVAFPGLACHKGEHDRLLQKNHEFHTAIVEREAPLKTICMEMVAVLADWFAQHFSRMDREVVTHLLYKKRVH